MVAPDQGNYDFLQFLNSKISILKYFQGDDRADVQPEEAAQPAAPVAPVRRVAPAAPVVPQPEPAVPARRDPPNPPARVMPGKYLKFF